ncbi:carboxypeptidase-like regulatory domain-containing protein [Thermoplasma volcanium]|uniref:carboxypeptidase-like regulatory domain-containing protein n=1 Tax=Thermoplasma volcanium TaxID=50339 RepID=UPI00138A4153|nr:carboxypeptidase-like regulatory domain-containing protein [Thermoplasma volcanium]
MSPRYVALIIVGVVIFSSLFSIANIGYPTGNPVHVKIKKEQQNITLFANQTLNKYSVGISNTYFVPSGNATIKVNGYAYNATSSKPLENFPIVVAAYGLATQTNTNMKGEFHFTVLKTGNAKLAFFVPGYNVEYHNFDFLSSGSLNISVAFQPSSKYVISGFTLYGNTSIPHVGLTFYSMNSVYTFSNSDGYYSALLYNGTYTVAVEKPGFSSIASPQQVTVSGENMAVNISLTSSGQRAFNVSGFVVNQIGIPVPYATVSFSGFDVTSNSTGHYSIAVSAGYDILIATAPGYGAGSRDVYVKSNMSNVNITLPPESPLVGGKATSQNYQLNSSNLNYSSNGNYTIEGYAYFNSSGLKFPLSNKEIEFVMKSEGDEFYVVNTTNDEGHYAVSVKYPGLYVFYILTSGYYPLNLSIYVKQSQTHKNLLFSPVSSRYLNISVSDYYGPASFNITVAEGHYYEKNMSANNYENLTLPEGTYNITISKVGYYSQQFNVSLTSNETFSVNLKPVNSLGNDINENVPVEVPLTSYPQVSSSTLSAQKQVKVGILFKSKNSGPLRDLEYEMFMNFSGKNYRMLGYTNSSGTALINFGYTGYYNLYFLFLDYYANLSLNITGNTNTSVNASQRVVYNYGLTLYNYSNYFKLSNETISNRTLSVNNDSFQIEPTKSSENATSVSFAFSLPEYNYTFTYQNKSFVTFNMTVHLHSNSSSMNALTPYLIIIKNESAIGWSFSLLPALHSMKVKNTLIVLGAFASSYTFSPFINYYDENNTPLYKKDFVLNTTNPQENITFNVTNEVKQISLTDYEYKSHSPIPYIVEVFYWNDTSGSVPEYIHNISFTNIKINASYMLTNITAPWGSYFYNSSNGYANLPIIDFENGTSIEFEYDFNSYEGAVPISSLNITVQYYTTEIEVI